MINGVYAYSTFLAVPPTPAPTTPRIVAEIKGVEKLSSKNVKDQLKALAEEVKSNEGVKVYIIFHSKRLYFAEGGRRANMIRNSLIKKHKLKSEQIITVDGGIDEDETIKIYLVPLSAAPPFSNLTLYKQFNFI